MTVQKKHRLRKLFFFLALMVASHVTTAFSEGKSLGYKILRTLPHNPQHFTQGLLYRQNRLYESAGGYGESALYEKDFAHGKVLREHRFPDRIFAEGIALLGDELYLLTWRNGLGYVFDGTLKLKRQFEYRGEGWGLTDDGRQLIMSDGSDRLRWLDPLTLKATREVKVRDGRLSISLLNELEFAHGLVLANVWYSDRIALIAPADGQVRAWLDLSGLRRQMTKPADWDERENVLNGIAHDPQRDVYYVTGKRWPQMFELQIADIPALR